MVKSRYKIAALTMLFFAIAAPGLADELFSNDSQSAIWGEARELVLSGSDKEEVERAGLREVHPDDFGKYQIVVDIFRSSPTKRMLGDYLPEYHDTLTASFEEKNEKALEKLANKRFQNLSNSEFAVVSIDGVPTRAYLISGALESTINQAVKENGIQKVDPLTGEAVTKVSKKTTPPGNYLLTPVILKTKTPGQTGKSSAQNFPFPFLSSSTYERSSMFWGLWIFGGYFIHQTPHYGQLGSPASMGCLRQSSPDAMWLWNLVTNENGGRMAMIRIHKMNTQAAYERVRELVYDPNYSPQVQALQAATSSSPRDLFWLIASVNASLQNIKDFMKKTGSPEFEGVSHGGWNTESKEFNASEAPLCAGYDCIQVWGDPIQKIAKLKTKDEEARLKARFEDVQRGLPIPRQDSIKLKLVPLR